LERASSPVVVSVTAIIERGGVAARRRAPGALALLLRNDLVVDCADASVVRTASAISVSATHSSACPAMCRHKTLNTAPNARDVVVKAPPGWRPVGSYKMHNLRGDRATAR